MRRQATAAAAQSERPSSWRLGAPRAFAKGTSSVAVQCQQPPVSGPLSESTSAPSARHP